MATETTTLVTPTPYGTPIVYQNERTGMFDVIRYGDMTAAVALDFLTIEAVGTWARLKGGALGAIKEHWVLGRYRAVYLPDLKKRSV